MDMLEKIKSWLRTCPVLKMAEIHTDHLLAEPGSVGLYQKGLQEVSRREDLMGNVRVHCRYRFLLRCMVLEDSGWLSDFQQWVQQQSARRLTPVFGDVITEERLQAVDGKLLERSQPGTRVCEIALAADFIKIYEEKDHGKN
ncbi:MAG: hypothetical protein IJW41_01895 [Oscillospiraceae bacterium]|nr:hypothetical protein [Oscillospiraceae bacterium]